MERTRNDPNSMSRSSADVDQAILNLRGLLTQQKDRVIGEMVITCYMLQNSPGFMKIAEVFLIYMERIKDLPALDVQTVDQTIELLLLICERKQPNRSFRAFSILTRLLVNPDEAPGNNAVRERFKLNKDVLRRFGFEDYLLNTETRQVALEFAVFLCDYYEQVLPSHITQDPEKIAMINQAEKRAVRNQIQSLKSQCQQNRDSVSLAFQEVMGEISNLKNIVQKQNIPNPNADMSPMRGGYDDRQRRSADRPLSRQKLPSLPNRPTQQFPSGGDQDSSLLYNKNEEDKKTKLSVQILEKTMRELLLRHDNLSDRLNEFEKKAEKGMQVLKENFVSLEAYKKEREEIKDLIKNKEVAQVMENAREDRFADRRSLEKEMDRMFDDFVAYKRDIELKIGDFLDQKKGLDNKITEVNAYKREIATRLEDFVSYKKEVEFKLMDVMRKNMIDESNKILASTVPADNNSSSQKEIKDLKEKFKQLEFKIVEIKSSTIMTAAPNLTAAVFPEVSNRELTVIKTQQDVMGVKIQQISHEVSEHISSQILQIDDIKRKLRESSQAISNIEEKMVNFNFNHDALARDFSHLKINVGSLLNSSQLHTSNIEYTIEKRSVGLIDDVKQDLDKYVQLGLSTVEKKVFLEIKKEIDSKLAEQLQINEILRSNIEAKVQMLESSFTAFQSKPFKFQEDFLSKEEYKRKAEGIWDVISSIGAMLNVKVNRTTGVIHPQQ